MATHFFHSGMLGAPTNTNAAGSTLAIIRACLSTGFNLLTPQTATVASGVMTLTYSAPHGYEDKVWIRLDGAPGGSLVQRATASAGASSLTIPVTGFADGPVSGALSTRVAPADWEEAFTDTGVGVFRSKVIGPGSTRFFYRVADTVSGGSAAMLRGFESMTDASTGLGAFPTTVQVAGNGLSITRSTSGTARAWAVVADGRTVYVCLASSSNGSSNNFFFGDESPFGSADLFLGSVSNSNFLAQTAQRYRPRIAAGTGTSTIGAQLAIFSTTLPYPSPIDGGMVFQRPVITLDQGSTSALRGTMRGLMHCSANPVLSDVLWRIFETVPGAAGRVLCLRDNGSSQCIAVPIDEDWA